MRIKRADVRSNRSRVHLSTNRWGKARRSRHPGSPANIAAGTLRWAKDGAWYHGFWQYMRVMGVAKVSGGHAQFLALGASLGRAFGALAPGCSFPAGSMIRCRHMCSGCTERKPPAWISRSSTYAGRRLP